MRHLFLAVPIVALSGCSFLTGGEGYDLSSHDSCHNSCGSSYAYSVADTGYSEPVHGTTGSTSYHGTGHTTSHHVATPTPSVSYHTQGNHGTQGAYYAGNHGNHGLRGMHRPMRPGYKYGNIGLINYDVDDGGYGVVGRVGYQTAGILGAELEGTIGFKDQDFDRGANEVTGGQDYSAAAFAVARLPVGNKFSVHARGGYHFTNIDSKVRNGATTTFASDTVDGFAYGGGGEYRLNDRDSVRLDYTRYEYGDTINAIDYKAAESVALAYNRRF
jgi:hypothetical protein